MAKSSVPLASFVPSLALNIRPDNVHIGQMLSFRLGLYRLQKIFLDVNGVDNAGIIHFLAIAST